MKKVSKRGSLFLAFLVALNLLPGSLLVEVAEAAEEAYTVLCEPNIEGGFQDETYNNVAAVWEYIYYDPVSGQTFEITEDTKNRGYWERPMHLMAADSSGVHAVSDWYRHITGLSASGFAAAQNFDEKWGIINSHGEVIADFIYNYAYMPTDDGYVIVEDNRSKDLLLNLNSGDVTALSRHAQAYNNGLLSTGSEYLDINGNKAFEGSYRNTGIFNNGYAIVEDREGNHLIIDTHGTVLVSDADKNFGIVSWAIVSAEGLVPVYLYDENGHPRRFGYIDLSGTVVLPQEDDEQYYSSYNFHNGYAEASTGDATLIDADGNCVIPRDSTTGSYQFSNVSNTGFIWAGRYGMIEAVYQVEPRGTQGTPSPTPENNDPSTSSEYLYNTYDPGADFILPAEWLNDVVDIPTAVETVTELATIMTDEQKAAPTSIDLATLYAETAAAKAATKNVENGDILINAAALSDIQDTAAEAADAVEAALISCGVTTTRYISKTVVLTSEATDVTIQIDPDVLGTEVDKVRVETPAYALTFKLSDLAPDLTQELTFYASDASTNASARTGARTESAAMVSVTLPNGGTTNSITVSLPTDDGAATYQTVASTDGTATASKYNPATTNMDGKVNQSGIYTVITNEKDFSDISGKSQEMQNAIRYLASKGIISGKTETTFDPDGSITRAEIATLLVKALGKLDASAVATFSDVKSSSWYYTAAASSQKHGLIKGYDDNTFRGTTEINKVQTVVVSSRVLTSEMRYKVPTSPESYLSKYSDNIANWAQSEVALATRENLVVYRTDGTFSGDKNMTRGDAAIIIYRLFQRIW